ncbi:MAG: LysR family transcriptional regulator [Pseudomonadota bacterium]
MIDLNYHHLRYFWVVATEGHLTRAADKLNLSQSALSIQIKTLEDRLGEKLFLRQGRSLVLTEAGRIALDHAERIFATGRDLVDTLSRAKAARVPLRVGAEATLSRNFQLQFLRPVLADSEIEVILRAGDGPALIEALLSLGLDLVLTTEPPQGSGELIAHRIAEQGVALHGVPERLRHATLRDLLAHEPIILPSESPIRRGFDALAARLNVHPRIAARVDDMAMVRLLAREGIGLALAPPVVLADEIRTGRLATAPFDLDIAETFYAITTQRRFPHPALKTLLPQAD